MTLPEITQDIADGVAAVINACGDDYYYDEMCSRAEERFPGWEFGYDADGNLVVATPKPPEVFQ